MPTATTARPTTGYGGDLDAQVWERIRRAMTFQEGDRVPIWDYIDNTTVVDHFSEEGDSYADAMVKTYHGLGIDLCRGFGASYSEEQDQHAEEVTGEQSSRVTGRSNWRVRYPIESLEDLRAYKTEPTDLDHIREHWPAGIRANQELFAPHTMYVPGSGCGFHGTFGLMGQERFGYYIYDAPKELERLLEVAGETAARYATVAAEEQLAPIHFIGDDIAYKDALLYSPEYLRRTFVPMLKRCVDILHAADIQVVYHSDGCLWEIMDDLMDMGIDGLNPIEPLAGMTLQKLHARYGDDLLLVGGIDCSQLLPLGTPDDIRATVRDDMRAVAPGGGLFIGSSSELTPSTPLENSLAFYEACRTYGTYPIAT
ncbi:hypothetical protein HN371_15480 [Candidatus Poribacteria bacterium]|jgi:hypothetical protein|nr:hypothetical protein [Candidatus Poribacteria bacterium]MBT5535518.1 hypothetical protein [Candidatus Poribacteria bacterium]MBT5711009.1 hypothetical protein [Candidatus Poribacteria bacterium]MBT7097402.1 hypothetical protein [Candidatus Poribacteria bacterium]MBT7803956.1 hypothetical protein [Candidatus Poribacteria bacterium]